MIYASFFSVLEFPSVGKILAIGLSQIQETAADIYTKYSKTRKIKDLGTHSPVPSNRRRRRRRNRDIELIEIYKRGCGQ
jgi:hypothetical protein